MHNGKSNRDKIAHHEQHYPGEERIAIVIATCVGGPEMEVGTVCEEDVRHDTCSKAELTTVQAAIVDVFRRPHLLDVRL